MAKLKVIKKTEEVETSNMDDKKPGVKQKIYNPDGSLYSRTSIDTAGYSAGAKKFPKVKILAATGKTKEGMAKRKEVDRAIKNPVNVAFGPSGYSANDMVNIKKRIIELDKRKEIEESNKEK